MDTLEAAVLMRDLFSRILDISASGCLIESRRPLDVGTLGRLRLKFGSQECAEDVEVVRCDVVDSARHVYHVGLRFLWTTPRGTGSIRHAVLRHAEIEDANQEAWVV